MKRLWEKEIRTEKALASQGVCGRVGLVMQVKRRVEGGGRYSLSNGGSLAGNGQWEGDENSIREEQLSTATLVT